MISERLRKKFRIEATIYGKRKQNTNLQAYLQNVEIVRRRKTA